MSDRDENILGDEDTEGEARTVNRSTLPDDASWLRTIAARVVTATPPMSPIELDSASSEPSEATLERIVRRLEFGIYRITDGREGLMCGICYRFEREGHKADCWLGKAIVTAKDRLHKLQA